LLSCNYILVNCKIFKIILILIKAVSAVKFTVYNYNSIYNIIDPCYTSDNVTSCFKTPEELANYMGPSIYGVSLQGNNTLVNSFGYYYSINDTVIQHIKKTNKIIKSKK
jgi:hypothetical protein